MITLGTELTPEGIVCDHATLGKVATIIRVFQSSNQEAGWYVQPYKFPPYEMGKTFKSMRAAEFYALVLAYEMMEMQTAN
jgi:hypothetical protein